MFAFQDGRDDIGREDGEAEKARDVGVVSEGWIAAHPHAFFLGGGDLVADALAGDLALELRE